jgi:hypothetical protein
LPGFLSPDFSQFRHFLHFSFSPLAFSLAAFHASAIAFFAAELHCRFRAAFSVSADSWLSQRH